MVGLAVSRSVAPTTRANGPSLATEPARSSSSNSTPVRSVRAVRKARTESVTTRGNWWAPRRGTAGGGAHGRSEFGDGFVAGGHGAVSRAPPHAQPHPGDPLLGDLDQVGAQVV